MLYHYTSALSGRKILADGVIRATPMHVYSSLNGPLTGEEPVELQPPVVWLTINPILDLAVVVRETVHGMRLNQPGSLRRFVVADAVAPLGLAEWAEKHGHALDLFEHMVITGKMAGSDYTCWHLAEGDVTRDQWLAIEVWDGRGGWQPITS